jgi:hypothetical protein
VSQAGVFCGCGQILLQSSSCPGAGLQDFEDQSNYYAGIIWQLDGAASHFAAGILRGECDFLVETIHVDARRNESPVSSQTPSGRPWWKLNQPVFGGAHVLVVGDLLQGGRDSSDITVALDVNPGAGVSQHQAFQSVHG